MNHSHLSDRFASTIRFNQPVSWIKYQAGRTALACMAPLLLGGAIALPVVLVPQVAEAQEQLIIRRVLTRGDRGPDVLQLQRALVQRGFLDLDIPNSEREGFFGPATEKAVKAFQRSQSNLVADGVFGERSLRQLFGIGPVETRAFAIGVMQAQLAELGYYQGGLDGEYGGLTRTALQDLRDEAFVPVEVREDRLEGSFISVEQYYNRQRERLDLPHRSVLENRVQRTLPESKLFGYSALGFDSGTVNTGGGGRPADGRSTDGRSPYIVVVPTRKDSGLLRRIQVFEPNAFLMDGRRGDYIQVGAYGSRGNADRLVEELEILGFDARVIFNND